MMSLRRIPVSRLAIVVIAVCLASQLAAIAPAQAVAPPNDDFDSAAVVASLPASFVQDTTEATTAGDDPAICAGGNANSVWYRYTPATTRIVTIDTSGSDYDTVLAVWTGSRGSLSSVICNDDYYSLQSQVEFTAEAGTTYYIEATSYSSPGGQLALSFSALAFMEASFRSTGAYDGWVRERGEDSGLGGKVDATMSTGRLGDDAYDRQYRTVLDFDTSSLPDDAVVVGVTLKIRRSGAVGTNPIRTHGKLFVGMRTGYYHNNPLLERVDFHAPSSRNNVGRFIRVGVDRWYRAPLRPVSYPLVNLTGHTQFRLYFEVDDNDDLSAEVLKFYSGDYPTAANRPELIISYYVP